MGPTRCSFLGKQVSAFALFSSPIPVSMVRPWPGQPALQEAVSVGLSPDLQPPTQPGVQPHSSSHAVLPCALPTSFHPISHLPWALHSAVSLGLAINPSQLSMERGDRYLASEGAELSQGIEE